MTSLTSAPLRRKKKDRSNIVLSYIGWLCFPTGFFGVFIGCYIAIFAFLCQGCFGCIHRKNGVVACTCCMQLAALKTSIREKIRFFVSFNHPFTVLQTTEFHPFPRPPPLSFFPATLAAVIKKRYINMLRISIASL